MKTIVTVLTALLVLSMFPIMTRCEAGSLPFVIDHNWDWVEGYCCPGNFFICEENGSGGKDCESCQMAFGLTMNLVDWDSLMLDGPDKVLTKAGILNFDDCQNLPLGGIAVDGQHNTLGIASSVQFDLGELDDWSNDPRLIITFPIIEGTTGVYHNGLGLHFIGDQQSCGDEEPPKPVKGNTYYLVID